MILRSFFTKNWILLSIMAILIALPYFWFGDSLYVWGDDTRLFYSYPLHWLENLSRSTRFKFSGNPTHNPQSFMIPFLLFASLLDWLLPSFIVQNTLFSCILIAWYYFSFKYLELLLANKNGVSYFGAFIYLTSPILLINQFNIFLYAIRLIPLIPLILFYWTLYVYRWSKISLLKLMLALFFWSLWIFSLPWLLWFLIPFLVVYIIYLLKIKHAFVIYRRLLILLALWALSQIFWIIPFLSQFFYSWSSLTSDVTSSSMSETFAPTVNATSENNSIIDPLTNNFHRFLQEKFQWKTNDLYTTWYNHIYYLSFIYVLLIVGSLLLLDRKSLKNNNTFTTWLIWFLVILVFFTVKVGVFEDAFLMLGHIPWFVMFRNFYDKFALSYLLFFVFILTASLNIFSLKIARKYFMALYVFLIALSIYVSIPFFTGVVFKYPLWTTNNITKNISIPDDYLSFMNQVSNVVSPTKSIFIIPYGVSSYSYIHGKEKNQYFIGRSPIELFANRNDYSGRLSFKENDRVYLENLLKIGDIRWFYSYLNKFNIFYIVNYPNLNEELLNSYLFDKDILQKQKGILNTEFTRKILTSNDQNYELYEIINIPKSPLIYMDEDKSLLFQKRQNYLYEVNVTISWDEKLSFKDPYHDWRSIYPWHPIQTGDCSSIQYYSWSTSQTDPRRDTSTAVLGTGIDGQQIRILTHVTSSGELLADILSWYQIDLPTLYQYNSRINSIVLPANTILKIPLPQASTTSGDNVDDLTRWPTSECVRDGYSFFQWEELSYLWRQPLRDDTHTMIYDYANWWTIDLNTGALDASLHSAWQTMLQQWLREGWITENPDGSYDVALTLYFRPQSWFYLWLLISGTTFLWLISWLLRDYRNNKKLPS